MFRAQDLRRLNDHPDESSHIWLIIRSCNDAGNALEDLPKTYEVVGRLCNEATSKCLARP